MQLITGFTVVGRPAPQGSKTPLGKGRFKEQSPHLQPWRNDVRNAAMQAFGEALIAGPVFTEIVFMFARPNAHHVSNKPDRPLKSTAPFWHTITPDRDKLERATNDALTGVVWFDDCQVCGTLSHKIYAEPGIASGALIRIYSLQGQKLPTFADTLNWY